MPARAIAKMRRSHDEGTAAIEFAFIAPLLIMVLLGMMQFGLIFFQVMQAEHAAREGVRSAALRYPTATVVSRTRAAAPGIVLTGAGAITMTPADPSAVNVLDDTIATVNVRVSPPVIMPMLSGRLDPDDNGKYEYTATARQRVE